MQRIRNNLTYANVVSTIALVLVLGGATAVAATNLGKNSVGTKQLKANAVTGAKVKDGTLGGADVNASSLGQVPSANAADTANSAKTAQRATTAGRADSAASADRAARADQATQATTATRADTADLATRISPPELLHVVGTGGGEPGFGAGWQNVGPNRRASFYMDKQGIVHLQGEVKRAPGSNAITIFTLPAAYAPAPEDGQFFPAITIGAGLGTIGVEPNGEVNFFPGALANVNGVFLNGITWRAGN